MFFNECMKFSSETQYTYRYSNFKGSSDSVLLELNFLPTIYFLKTFNLLVDPFHATGLSLYPLKISENLWFSDFFRDYRKKLVGHEIRMKLVKKSYWNGCVEHTINATVKRYTNTYVLLLVLAEENSAFVNP